MKIKRKYLIGVIVLGLLGVNVPILAVAGQWSASGSTIYYNDGNVSIGDNSNLRKLQVSSVVSIGRTLSSGQGTGLQFLDSGTQHVGIRWSDDDTDNLVIEDASASQNPDTWYNNDTVNLIIRNGRLGIGTLSPNSGLHVKRNGATMTIEGTDHSIIQWYPDGIGAGRKAWMGFGNGTDNNFTIQNQISGANIVLETDAVIVTGKLKTREVKVTNNVWADYVFENNYQLRPLKEVEAYIKENKHLPNIPSASEIKAEGLSLGEMQQKQMEKIEELTLYVIELQKQLDALKAQLNN